MQLHLKRNKSRKSGLALALNYNSSANEMKVETGSQEDHTLNFIKAYLWEKSIA